MQKYVQMMTQAVKIFKNTCLILELQKSEGLQNEDFLSILNPSVTRAALIFADRSRYLHATCMINENNH